MLLIQNAHVIDPASGRSEECDILVEGDSLIRRIFTQVPPPLPGEVLPLW